MSIKRFFPGFLPVVAIVFGLGYVFMLHLTDYLQLQYSESQLITNKQSANNLTIFIENQLNSGYGKQQIMKNFQSALEKTNTKEGFIGLYDRYNAELIAHPDKDRIGMQLTSDYKVEQLNSGKIVKLRNMILNATPGGGILHTPHEKYILYIAPIAGSDWVLAIHQNPKKIKKTIADQQRRMLLIIGAIALLAGLCVGFLTAFFDKRLRKELNQSENSGSKLRKLEANLKYARRELEEKQEKLDFLEATQLSLNEHIANEKELKESHSLYAQKLQKSLLPSENHWANIFREHFFIYRSQGGIGQDFCRLKQVDNIVILATGRIPFKDEMFSVFNNLLIVSFLNDIIAELLKNVEKLTAAVIGEELMARLHSAEMVSGGGNEMRSDPDMAFVIIDMDTFKVQFAAANRPLYIVRNRKMTEVQSDIVGGEEFLSLKTFTNKRAQLRQGDILYLFSEGMYVPENQEDVKAFREDFKKSLPELSGKSLEGQRIVLEDTLARRYKKEAQKEDILIAGIRL